MAEILGWYAFRTLGMYVYGIAPSDYTVQTLELKLKSQSLDKNSRAKAQVSEFGQLFKLKGKQLLKILRMQKL